MINKLEIIFQQEPSEKKNKKIEDITKKVQKIEKLNIDFQVLNEKIKSIKVEVDQQSAKEKQHFCIAKEHYIIMLIDKYALKSLLRWQKDILSYIINEEYEILNDLDYDSEDLSDTFARYVKMQNAEMSNFERQFAQQTIAEMMLEFTAEEKDFEFDFSKMNDPKYKRDFEEKLYRQQEKKHQQQKEREKEEQVSNTDIDFQRIYKKLAKLVHPDLYKSNEEKAVKELQMQRLTIAWNDRNYYELLMIWLDVDPQNKIELEITSTNQKSIINQLNIKIKNLEAETYRTKFHYEDTSFYYRNFYSPHPKITDSKIKGYVNSLIDIAKETTKQLKIFSNTVMLKKHLAKIHRQNQETDFTNFLRNFS